MMVVVTVQCVYKALQASLDDFKKKNRQAVVGSHHICFLSSPWLKYSGSLRSLFTGLLTVRQTAWALRAGFYLRLNGSVIK